MAWVSAGAGGEEGYVGGWLCIRRSLLDGVNAGPSGGSAKVAASWNIHRVPTVYPAIGQGTPAYDLE